MSAAIGIVPASEPAKPRADLSVTTRLVEVNVVATNRRGQPVTGLTADDFEVYDKGRRRPVAHFTAIAGEFSPEAAQARRPNTFSNRVGRLSGAASVTAILFDGLNTRATDQVYAQRQIVAFLRTLPPGARVAIYALGRGLDVLQDFTADSGALIRAIEGQGPRFAPAAAPPERDTLEPGVVQFGGWLAELRLNLVRHYDRDRSLRTIRSLVAIANHLERLPGRKNLIWVSGSFPVWIRGDSAPPAEEARPGVQTFRAEIERAARALDTSGMAIYPVDARGLLAPSAFEPHRGAYRPESRGPEWSKMRTMEAIARRTGGRAFFNNNDLSRAFRGALADSRYSYVLDFHPAHDRWTGEFRPIKVRVKRKGVRLRYRSGYFAQPGPPATDWYRRSVLDAAMWSPTEATGVGLTVRVAPKGGGTLDLELRLVSRDLALREDAGAESGELEIRLVQIGRADRFLKTDSHIARLRLGRSRYEQAMKEGVLPLLERVRLLPGAALLRVLVYDIRSGALGSVNIPVSEIAPAGG